MPEIVYRGDTEGERRESAIFHTRMVDMVNRLQKTQFPLADGDLQMFAYLEGFLIEIPEEYYQQAQQAQDLPAEEYYHTPQPAPVPPPAGPQEPPMPAIMAPAPPPAPAAAPPAAKPQRGRLRQVD